MKMRKEACKTEERARGKVWRSLRWVKHVIWQEHGTWMRPVGEEADLDGAENRRWRASAATLRHELWTMKGFWNIRVSDLIKSEFYQGYAGGVWRMKSKEASLEAGRSFWSLLWNAGKKEVKDLILNKSKESKKIYMQDQNILSSFIRKNFWFPWNF